MNLKYLLNLNLFIYLSSYLYLISFMMAIFYFLGPWRWYDESMLDCCEPLEKIKADGITFGKVACLAQCAGAKVEAFRTNQSNVDDFRDRVIKCTSSEDCHLITSYHRKAFKQVCFYLLVFLEASF